MAKLTAKQQRFIDEYLIDLNATQAAIRAGYSKKTAYSIGEQNLKKLEVQKQIQERMAAKEDALIAKQDEVLRYLTAVLRGESESSEIVVEGAGDGTSKAREVIKRPSEKDKLKAAELLGKRYSLFTDKLEVESSSSVQIVDDIPLPAGDGPWIAFVCQKLSPQASMKCIMQSKAANIPATGSRGAGAAPNLPLSA